MRLHTATKVCGDVSFGYFLVSFHVLIEICPLVQLHWYPSHPQYVKGSQIKRGRLSGGDP